MILCRISAPVVAEPLFGALGVIRVIFDTGSFIASTPHKSDFLSER